MNAPSLCRNGYEEFAVSLDFLNPLNISSCGYEVYVHRDVASGALIDAYCWADDLKVAREDYRSLSQRLPSDWVSRRRQLNPLFVHLTPTFIGEFREMITDQIADELAEREQHAC